MPPRIPFTGIFLPVSRLLVTAAFPFSVTKVTSTKFFCCMAGVSETTEVSTVPWQHPHLLSTAKFISSLSTFCAYICWALSSFDCPLVWNGRRGGNTATQVPDFAWLSNRCEEPLTNRPGKEQRDWPLTKVCIDLVMLENPMDRGAWWATVHGVAKSWPHWALEHTHDWKN